MRIIFWSSAAFRANARLPTRICRLATVSSKSVRSSSQSTVAGWQLTAACPAPLRYKQRWH